MKNELFIWIALLISIVAPFIFRKILAPKGDGNEDSDLWSIWWAGVAGVIFGVISLRPMPKAVFPKILLQDIDVGVFLIPLAIGFFLAISSSETYTYEKHTPQPFVNFCRGFFFSLTLIGVRLVILEP